MAWYNKINPFLKTEEKAPSFDNSMFQNYTIGGTLSNVSPSDYISAYGQVGWVFACVSRISSAVAETNWRLYQINDSTKEKEEIISHPVLSLFDFVNEYTTGLEMMEQTQTYIDLVGEAFWLVIKDRIGRPAELWAINPSKIKVVPHSKDYIAGYVYVNGHEKIPLETDEVIHIKLPNPNNPYRGQSPIASIMSDIEAEKFSSQYNKSFFQNSAEPSGVINFEGTLTDSQYERLRYQWNEQHQGVSRSHKVAILEGGATWTGKTVNQKDMQFQQLRLMNRDVILGAYGMPLHILGISESVNRANAEASEYTFARWVLKPRLHRIRAKLNEQFIPMFGEDLYFDYDSPVPEDVQRNLSVADTGFKSGYITRNEARTLVGLDSVRNGDVFMMPLASVPESVTRQKSLKEMNDFTTEYKSYRAKSFLDKYDNFQNELENEFEKIYAKQKKEIVANLKDDPTKNPFNEMKWLEVMEESLTAFYKKSIAKAGKDAQEEIMRRANRLLTRSVKQTTPYSYDFDSESDAVVNFIRQNALSKSKLLIGTQAQEVRNLIIASRDIEGVGVDGLATQINQSFGDDAVYPFNKSYATKVARTETASALNHAVLESSKQSEVVTNKVWLTTQDGETRDDHSFADGQRVPVQEPFNVGGELLDAPALGSDPANNVNCRCTMLEEIDVDMLQEFVDAGVQINDPHTYYVNQFGDGQSENIETKESDYEYPLQEARCPDCDKLLAKKLLGTVSLYCSRCKKEIKFNDKSLTKQN